MNIQAMLVTAAPRNAIVGNMTTIFTVGECSHADAAIVRDQIPEIQNTILAFRRICGHRLVFISEHGNASARHFNSNGLVRVVAS